MRIVMPTCPCPQTLPAFVNTILMAYWTLILDWCSQQIYTHLIQRDSQHLLVRLQSRLQFMAVEAACAAFHHADSAGAPPTHPTAQLARALLVGYLYDWSLRQLEWQIRFNVIVKWFVGYPLFADGPDHATLERFQVWVAEHQPRAIFDDVLRQIDEAFPGERAAAEQAQIGDTYAMQADAAKESLVDLIRHTCKRLLSLLVERDPDGAARVEAQLDPVALFGPPRERREYHLTDAQRAARLQTTVLAALACTREVEAELATTPGRPVEETREIGFWIECVRKVIDDEVELHLPPAAPAIVAPGPLHSPAAQVAAPLMSDVPTAVDAIIPAGIDDPVCAAVSEPAPTVVGDPRPSDATATAASKTNPVGALVYVATAANSADLLTLNAIARAAHVKGAYRVGSATDPDATYRVHGLPGAGKTDLGYNINLLVSQHFVRETMAAPGAQPDATPLPAMLNTQQLQHDLIPAQVIYDSAAGPGKIRREVNLTTLGHTQIIAPLHGAGRRNGEFGPEDFSLSPDGSALTCPKGKTTRVAYRSDSGDGRQFRFLSQHCQGCPLWAQCRGAKQPTTSRRMRQVFISDYRPEVEAARVFNSTEAYTAAMKRRPGVERIIAALVRYNGGRRATRRGIVNADFQAKMNATAFNLKTWMRLLDKPEHQQALAAKTPVPA